jgi:hypothetical protein
MPRENADVSELIEIRAFRGTRRSSVYRRYVVSANAFLRILGTAEQHGLERLSSLDPHGPHHLDKSEAQQMADELGSIRSRLELPDLDAELTAIAEVARWCGRAAGNAWMKIERR